MKKYVKKRLKKPASQTETPSIQDTTRFQKRTELDAQLNVTHLEISQAKFNLIAKHILLALNENNTANLDTALDLLSSINTLHSMDTTLQIHVELQSQIADSYLRIGRSKNSRSALEKAKGAYRSAITLASVTGDDRLREKLRQNYRITLSLLGDKPQSPSLFKVA